MNWCWKLRCVEKLLQEKFSQLLFKLVSKETGLNQISVDVKPVLK